MLAVYAMHCHPLSQDLLGSEGPEYHHDVLDDQYSYSTYWYHQGSFIDPRLRSFPSYDNYTNNHFQGSFDNRRSFTSYDPTAQGFSPRSLRMNSESVLPHVFDPEYLDVDQFRHLRHLSPTDPTGFTLSSNTDSSVSDYALSPDVSRSPQSFPFGYTSQGMYGNSIAMPSVAGHAWTPQPSVMPTHSSTPVATHDTVPSMRHLQVTPDPEHKDEPMEERDILKPNINLPEEVDISEQIISPPDSGRERSVDDDETMRDAEEDVALESDNESEFDPRTSSPRRRSTIIARHSLRRTKNPKAVINPKARVTKPSQIQGSSANGTPRSKAKKKPPVTKKVASDSKSFPCAFHHYGCCATFANKNEWKRHVSSQHLQLGYYRCDMGTCSDLQKGFNDFNRKDLFTQHCRRMHAPWHGTRKGEDGVSKKEKDHFEKQLESIRARCWVDRRKAPQKTKCGFCGKKFVDGKESRGWDERMEHVGRHFEKDDKKSEDEAVDSGLRQWAISEGVVREGKKKGEFWLPGFEPAQHARGGRGQRRSKRFVQEEEEESEQEGVMTNSDNDTEEEEDDDAESEEDNTEVKLVDAPMKAEDSSDDDDDGSDIDAEAEDE